MSIWARHAQVSDVTGILFLIDYHGLGHWGRADLEVLKMKAGQGLEGYWNRETDLQICLTVKVKPHLVNTLQIIIIKKERKKNLK